MPEIIALTGISGVGKTTFLKRLREQIEFQHLEASELIRSACADRSDISSTDDLRRVDIGENQRLLSSAFRKLVDPHAGCVLIASHTVIEAPTGDVLIDPDVFAALEIDRLIFLKNNPSIIAMRRSADKSRNRPRKSATELDELQVNAEAQGGAICAKLGIPLTVFDLGQADAQAAVLFEKLIGR